MTDIIIAIILQMATIFGGQTQEANSTDKTEKEKKEKQTEIPIIKSKGGSSAYDDAPDR